MARRPRIVRSRRSGLRRYLGDDEYTMLVTRQHPFVLVRAAIDTFGLLLPLAIAAWGISGTEVLRNEVGTWLLRIVFVVMLVLLAKLAWRVLAWEFERVVVTDEKVIHVAGVLDKRIASTPLAKVSEFTVRQPIIGRIFDYGSLVVDVPGGRDQALHGLAYLPDPAGLYRLVSDQARRGRVHEGGGHLDGDEPQVVRVETSAPAPSAADVDRLERIGLPDPWSPTLEGDASDHTIRIPRVHPPRE
jgi:hypothetical protein